MIKNSNFFFQKLFKITRKLIELTCNISAQIFTKQRLDAHRKEYFVEMTTSLNASNAFIFFSGVQDALQCCIVFASYFSLEVVVN